MHRLALSIFLPIFQSINPYSIGKFIGKVWFVFGMWLVFSIFDL